MAPNGDLPLRRQPLEYRLVPWFGGRAYHKLSSKNVPEASGYLAHRTRRTVAGAQLNPAGIGVGRCALLSQRRQALYSLHLLRTGSAPRSLVIYGFLTNPGDVVVRCRPGTSQNKLATWRSWSYCSTEIVNNKTPHTPDINFYVVSNTRGSRVPTRVETTNVGEWVLLITSYEVATKPFDYSCSRTLLILGRLQINVNCKQRRTLEKKIC